MSNLRSVLSGRLSLVVTVALLLSAGSLPALACNGEIEVGRPDSPHGVIHRLSPQAAESIPQAITYLDAPDGRDPQIIIGPDERVQIEDTTQDPYRKIVYVETIDDESGLGKRCTGTFIGPKVVMTAAHCVTDSDFVGDAESVAVAPGLNDDLQPYGVAVAEYFWLPQDWIDNQEATSQLPDWASDYSLLILPDSTLGDTVGSMTIGVLDDAALLAADFNPTTAGYPSDKTIGTMWLGTAPAFTGVTDIALQHQIDSYQGQSGSAVWRASDQLIVGIETYETQTVNVSRRITQDVVDAFDFVCQALDCSINVASGGEEPPPPVDDAAFQHTWERTDKPVAEGRATRTWIWGPQPNTEVLTERYDEAPGGQRQVVYYDKSRMEINDPNGNPNDLFYVTNGLLATELITGRMQLGDNRFEERTPANVNVAGDANDPNGPTYATFKPLLGATAQSAGTTITQRVNRSSQVMDDPALAAEAIAVGFVDDVTNHSIAAPFWDFMNSSGVIYQNGTFTTAPLFENAFFATGRPITEPYWAEVLIGGQNKLVLMQCFERRCLTYTPDNDPEWRVEMGNIGQHYYAWRYEDGGNQPEPPVGASVGVCLDAAESEFLMLLNAYREASALEAFTNSAILNNAAYDHSLDMAQRGYFASLSPEGTTPQERAEAAGYTGIVAEDIAAAVESATDVLQLWQDNPDTDAILLSDTVAVGIGRVYVDGSEWGWYWTVEFGDLIDAPPTGCG